MPIQALIFDFDGLILDTETVEFEVIDELYREHGHQLRRERWVLNLGTHGQIDLYADLSTLAGRPLDLAELRTRQRRSIRRGAQRHGERRAVPAGWAAAGLRARTA